MVARRSSLLAVFIAVSLQLCASRAVNISSVWLLPQEGFPVFYRYFKDRVTWFEADAVCQFHHANLVTVDSSEQYDATRPYLKELDVVSNVWVGLKRSGSEGEFTWTDYKPLENGGYWQEQIPLTDNPVCAALDPSADFRWHPLSCGGPEVASFICQLEVPGWARKDDGCMVTSLPSLTVTYLPEQGAVELISDCGLDGTRRIACKGQANRDEMMKQLSCESSTEGQTEATSSNTWDNELPTRHRRDTEVTVDMASVPTTQGLSELNTTDSNNVATEVKEVTPVEAVEEKDSGVTSTQVLPQEMSAAEEPIKSTLDILTDKPSAVSKSPATLPPTVDRALFDEDPIHIPLNSLAKITSEEAGGAHEEAQSGEKRQVVVQSKPIPPSLRGNSPFPLTTVAPGKNETSGKVEDSTTQKPVEKESHEVFRESKADIALPEKIESRPVNFPPLSVYNVNSDRDPDESSARVLQTEAPKAFTDPSIAPNNENIQEASESKFFTRVVAEEATSTTSTVSPASGTKLTSKADTENDFFIVTESPSGATKQETAPALQGVDLTRPAALTMAQEVANDEAAPEAPERPNRGRLLIRPQHHSFYPYFLNRVLG